MKNFSLIIYNPNSGPKSNKFIILKLESKFKELNKSYKLVETKYKGHAENICSKKDILLYDSIIICGGDGTFNEVINSLIKSHKFNLPPVGFLPGGTGNAYMHDLEATNPDKAIALILNEHTKKIDVLKLEFKKNIEYCINIVGWGMVTDILILAEKMRLFGNTRYTLASLYYLFNLNYLFNKSIRNIDIF